MNRNSKLLAALRSIRCRFAREQRRDEGACDRLCRFSRWTSCELKVVADFVMLIIKRKRATRATFAAAAIASFVGILATPSQADPTIEEEILQAVSNALYIAYWDEGAQQYVSTPILAPKYQAWEVEYPTVGAALSELVVNSGFARSGSVNVLDIYGILAELDLIEYDDPYIFVKEGAATNTEFIARFVSHLANASSWEFVDDWLNSKSPYFGTATAVNIMLPKINDVFDKLGDFLGGTNGAKVVVSNDDSRILRKMDDILEQLRSMASNETQNAILDALAFMTNNWDGLGCSCGGPSGGTNDNDNTNFNLRVLLNSDYNKYAANIEWNEDEEGNLIPSWAEGSAQPSMLYLEWMDDIQNRLQDDDLDFGQCVTMFLQMQSSLQIDILTAHKVLYDALFNGTNGVITEVSELEQLQTEIQTQNQQIGQSLEYGLQEADISEDGGFLGRLKSILQRSFSPDQFDGVIHLHIPKFRGESASDEYIVEIDTTEGGWQKFRSFMRFSVGVLWGLLLWWIIRHVLILSLWFVFRSVEWALSVFGWQFKPLGALVDFLRAIS